MHQWRRHDCAAIHRCDIRTKGNHPNGTSGACAVAVDDAVFVLGGHTELGNSNSLYKLTLKDMTWECIEMASDECTFSPRDKFTAWEHDERFVLIFGTKGNICEFRQGRWDVPIPSDFIWFHYSNKSRIFEKFYINFRTKSNKFCFNFFIGVHTVIVYLDISLYFYTINDC